MRCSMARAALPGLLLLAACCSCAAVAAPRRTSLSPLVRYFVYDPNDFLVHRCCSAALASQYLDDQYSQDALFLRELNRSSSFVGPAQLHSRELRDIHAHILPAGVPSPAAQADVFILPLRIMFLTKWGWDTACQASCLPATRNDALADVFARLVHVTPGFRDHFWMTADLDGWNMLSPRPYDVKTRLSAGLTYSVPRELFFSTDSGSTCLCGADEQNIVVPMATPQAVNQLRSGAPHEVGARPIVPARSRARRLVSVCVERAGLGSIRGTLKAAVEAAKGNASATQPPPDFLIKFTGSGSGERWTAADTDAAQRESLVVLHLPGDNIMSSRIYTAFDSNTILASVDAYPAFWPGTEFKTQLLRTLPFPFEVPWERLILWVNGTWFATDPLAALKAAVDGLSEAEADARLAEMEHYRPYVTYTLASNRVAREVLQTVHRTARWV